MRRAFGLTLFTIILTASYASAEGPCDEDLKEYCADVKGGEGRRAVCLWKHRYELSDSCKEQIEADRSRAKGAEEACNSDIEKYCKDVEPGEGRVAACLVANQDKLSMACHKVVRVTKKRSQRGFAACKEDAKKLCNAIEPGKGRILACLNEKKTELSVGCTKFIERRK